MKVWLTDLYERRGQDYTLVSTEIFASKFRATLFALRFARGAFFKRQFLSDKAYKIQEKDLIGVRK